MNNITLPQTADATGSSPALRSSGRAGAVRLSALVAFAAYLACSPLASQAQGLSSLVPKFGNQQEVPGYDFAYRVSGSGASKPLQVFDDKEYTYFQFKAGEPVPAIFVTVDGQAIVKIPQPHGQYVRLPLLADEFRLKMGLSSSTVTYTGTRSTAVSVPTSQQVTRGGAAPDQAPPGTASIAPGPITPSTPVSRESLDRPYPRIAQEVNSYAVPIAGDAAVYPARVRVDDLSASPSAQAPGTVEVSVISFESGGHALSAQSRREIARIAGSIKPSESLEVTGYMDRSFKHELPQLRANAVQKALLSAGVRQRQISLRFSDSFVGSGEGKSVEGVTLMIRAAPSAPSFAQADAARLSRVDDNLGNLEGRLRDRRITPAKAAAEVAAVRAEAASQPVVDQSQSPMTGVAEAPINTWRLQSSDGTVTNAIRRWATQAGWTVLVKDAPDVRVNGDATMTRDGFVSAVDYVVSQAQTMGYKIRARAYSNKVLVLSAE